MKILRFCILSLLFTSFTTFAEPGDAPILLARSPATWWINLGVGAGTEGHFAGTASQLSFNGVLTEKLLLTIYNNYIGKSHDHYYDEDFYDTGIMLGLVNRHPKWFWSASAGIAYCRRHYSSSTYGYNYFHEKSDSAGIPAQIQLFWTPFNHFGMGLIGHAVAGGHSHASALFAIQLYN